MIRPLGWLALILPFHERLKARLLAGVLGLIYLGLYGIGRFWLSYFRTDPAIIFGLRQAQLASLAMAVIAVIAIPILIGRARAGREEPAEEPQGRACSTHAPHRVNRARVAASRATAPASA